ncbi:AMP-dependent synthetase and ligase, partial [mine drainage metagenome]
MVLTHANILANARGASEVCGFNERDVSLSWMPLTHDMGLIGFHLVMFFNRVRAHLMPTELFIRRPLLWLEFASGVRATILSSPNFGYKHYLKVLGERPVDGLDLSSVRLIFNGAEPISVELCNRFLERMGAARLSRTAMYPVYGLAEASLAVSFPPPGEALRTLVADRHHLAVGEPIRLLPAGSQAGIELVSEGKAIPYCSVRIVDDMDRALAQGQCRSRADQRVECHAGLLRGPGGERR